MAIKNLLEKIINYPIQRIVEGDIKHLIRNLDAAPACCGEPMEYIGEHSGFRLNTQFYQCRVCKRIELLHKPDWEK